MFLISAGRRRKADVRKSQDSWWRDLCRIGRREELIDPLPSNRRGGSLSMLLPRGLVTKCSRVASCSGRMVCAGTLGTPINRRNTRAFVVLVERDICDLEAKMFSFEIQVGAWTIGPLNYP
jgi:hypothetical protein